MASKKQKKRPIHRVDTSSPQYQVKKKLRDFNWKRLILLVLLTMAALTVQHITLVYLHSPIAMNAYLVIVFVTLVLSVVFNRGFQRGATPSDYLPRNWSAEEKEAFLAKEAKNQRIARVFMFIMVPFAFVLVLDFMLIVLGFI